MALSVWPSWASAASGSKPMSRIVTALTLMVIAIAVVGCGGATVIPPGAQTVQVTQPDAELVLAPSTVHAGDVYFVLESSVLGVRFVHRVADFNVPNGPPLPLGDDDIASLRQIGAAQNTVDGGLSIGKYGNVIKLTLVAGNYAFIADRNEGTTWSPSLASVVVLEVIP